MFHPQGKKISKLLQKFKIETRAVYPYPIHVMKAYKSLINNKSRLINSEKLSRGIFCLPLYPELSVKEIKYICKKLRLILKKI